MIYCIWLTCMKQAIHHRRDEVIKISKLLLKRKWYLTIIWLTLFKHSFTAQGIFPRTNKHISPHHKIDPTIQVNFFWVRSCLSTSLQARSLGPYRGTKVAADFLWFRFALPKVCLKQFKWSVIANKWQLTCQTNPSFFFFLFDWN